MIYHEKCAMFISGIDESWEVPVFDPEIMVLVYDDGIASRAADVTVKDSSGSVATFPVTASPALRARAELWAEQQRALETEYNLHGNDEHN